MKNVRLGIFASYLPSLLPPFPSFLFSPLRPPVKLTCRWKSRARQRHAAPLLPVLLLFSFFFSPPSFLNHRPGRRRNGRKSWIQEGRHFLRSPPPPLPSFFFSFPPFSPFSISPKRPREVEVPECSQPLSFFSSLFPFPLSPFFLLCAL